MKIGKKIFLALLCLSLTTLLISTAAGLFQFENTRRDIGAAQEQMAQELTTTNIKVMEAANEAMILTLAQTYAEKIENKFTVIAQQVLTVQNYLEHSYALGKPTVSRFPDDMYNLVPDVIFDDLEEEFRITASIRDLMASIMEANRDVDLYFVSEMGLILANRYLIYNDGEAIDLRLRPWYTGAIESGDLYWTPIYADALTGELTITCSSPVTDDEGKILGIIGNDVFIEALIDAVLTVKTDMIEYAFLLDENGNDFVGSHAELSLADFIVNNTHRSSLITRMLELEQGVGIYEDGIVMVAYAPIPVTGWRIGGIMNYREIIAPAQNMSLAITAGNEKFQIYLSDNIQNAIIISAAIALIMLLVVLLTSRRVAASITKPLALLTKGVEKISSGNLSYSIELKSGDELEILAGAFNVMTSQLQDYIINLTKVTAEKERISAELDVATKIQTSMLPCIFPPFPDHDEFDIYATMLPAKEVGGDFYDFFLVNDHTLAIVIADVSGKGIPAALFMVITKTLIKNNAQSGQSPAEVFNTVNNKLCENNDAGMFVTAFMAYLDIKSGKFTYVNAGHDPALIKKKDGDFNFLETKPAFILAGFEDVVYKEDEVILSPGDVVFLYTDGVTEAMNQAGELFKISRLEEVVNRHKNLNVNGLLTRTKSEIDLFADGAEQADDITMLALEYGGSE